MTKVNKENESLRMKYVVGELQGLRKVIEYLWQGDQNAFNALLFIKSNYKRWPEVIHWLKANNLRGKRLAEMFQNASPDGGGYHLGVEYILARIDGKKFSVDGIKIDQLI